MSFSVKGTGGTGRGEEKTALSGGGEKTALSGRVKASTFRMTGVIRKWPFLLLSLLVLGTATAATAADTAPTSTSTPPLFLITPTALAFGAVPVGSTSASQSITVENVSGSSQTMSGAGGGAGVFGGAQNCQGQTLAPGASCQMFYAFSPTSTGFVNGSTGGTWNGQSFALTFNGRGH
jgi:hypothetical protein